MCEFINTVIANHHLSQWSNPHASSESASELQVLNIGYGHPSNCVQHLVAGTRTLLLSENMKIICMIMKAAWASGVMATRMSSHLEVLRSSKYIPKWSTAWIMAPTPKPADEPVLYFPALESPVPSPITQILTTGYHKLWCHYHDTEGHLTLKVFQFPTINCSNRRANF